jgi:hypothetical protein
MTTPQPISFVGATADFRAGKATPRDLLERCLARVEEFEPAVGAFVCHDIAAARSAADRSAERWRAGRPLSPIDGMPLGIKDIIETADMATEQGSPLFVGCHTGRDAASVAALREAGAVILGKVVTTEFASTEPRGTRNPWDSARTPGGSSSGSAAAVACGMVSSPPKEDAVRIAAAKSRCHSNLPRVGGLTVSRATASGHTRPDPSAFTSGRSRERPKSTDLSRSGRPRPMTAKGHSSSLPSADAIGRGGSEEPLRISRRNGGSGHHTCRYLPRSNFAARREPRQWLGRVRTRPQRCGSTTTVPTLPPRSTSLWAAAVSYNGKRAATDKIRVGDAVQAAISDCARRRSGCGTPASDIE